MSACHQRHRTKSVGKWRTHARYSVAIMGQNLYLVDSWTAQQKSPIPSVVHAAIVATPLQVIMGFSRKQKAFASRPTPSALPEKHLSHVVRGSQSVPKSVQLNLAIQAIARTVQSCPGVFHYSAKVRREPGVGRFGRSVDLASSPLSHEASIRRRAEAAPPEGPPEPIFVCGKGACLTVPENGCFPSFFEVVGCHVAVWTGLLYLASRCQW
jgi:hypothetical protein